MYEEFYGFCEKPFSIVSDPSFLYLSDKHRTALTYLEYGLMDSIGFIVLTGEIGTGKTTLIKQLLKQIEQDKEVAVVFNTNVTPEQLLEMILDEFEVERPAQGKTSYLDALNEFLLSSYGLGKRSLVIVDEAQNLSHEALEEIRMLSNLQADKESLLQILLVGQPPLRTKLRDPSLAQLAQRIAVNYHLGPLNIDETNGYIAHRLKVAGALRDNVFTAKAIERIFHVSRGIPRSINLLCDAALVYGFADQIKTIDDQVVEEVVKDKQEHGVFIPVPIGHEIQGPDEDSQGLESLLHRLQWLEQRVDQLAGMMEWRAQELERRAESYKDALVNRLDRMLVAERARADRLLVNCNLLKYRLKRKEPNLPHDKVGTPGTRSQSKPGGRSLAEKTTSASTPGNPRVGWTKRLGNTLRKSLF